MTREEIKELIARINAENINYIMIDDIEFKNYNSDISDEDYKRIHLEYVLESYNAKVTTRTIIWNWQRTWENFK